MNGRESLVQGKHHGAFRLWHENGTLAEEVTMCAGEPDGIARAFIQAVFLNWK